MSIWPFVSRAEMEREVARAIQTNEMFIADREKAETRLALVEKVLDYEQRRNAELVDRLLSLKLVGGAVEVPKADVQHVAIVSPPDELRDLIHSQCGSDLRKRGLMLAQLRRDRADGVDAEEIQRRIEQGVQSDGVPI